MKRIIIAIDGPAASGKSTTAKLIAHKLSYLYIDTGAMYRACALAALRAKVALDDDADISYLLKNIDIRFLFDPSGNRLLLNGEDVTGHIRDEQVSRLASDISALPPVRYRMVELQREMGRDGGVVLDGRDIGTFVFPGAELKFYLDADVNVRAQRRWLELQARGVDSSFEAVLSQMKERDKNDSSRALAPLKPAEDAIIIDNTELTIADQTCELWRHICQYFGSDASIEDCYLSGDEAR
ncbi:MAG: (d)CMP kinase [Candidatus Cloacimonetes bacterium]|nr:(d)CMP kinase [Candidatus Cloacimonadota bacterium]